jgi:hypothetical protein
VKAGPIEIGRLLQIRQRFCVPIYQRHYVWTRERQWEPFWSDVRTKAIERLAGRERRFSHLIGAVVLETRGGVLPEGLAKSHSRPNLPRSFEGC